MFAVYLVRGVGSEFLEKELGKVGWLYIAGDHYHVRAKKSFGCLPAETRTCKGIIWMFADRGIYAQSNHFMFADRGIYAQRNHFMFADLYPLGNL